MGVVVNFLHRRSVGEVVNSDSHNYMHTASVSILVLQIHTAAYVRSTFHEMNVLRRFSEALRRSRQSSVVRQTKKNAYYLLYLLCIRGMIRSTSQ